MCLRLIMINQRVGWLSFNLGGVLDYSVVWNMCGCCDCNSTKNWSDNKLIHNKGLNKEYCAPYGGNYINISSYIQHY